MWLRSALFWMRSGAWSASPEIGEVPWVASHSSMAARSYVWPSPPQMTGSSSTRLVIGQSSGSEGTSTRGGGASASNAPGAAAAAAGMLSAASTERRATTVVRQIGAHFLYTLLRCAACSALVMALVVFLSQGTGNFSRSVPIIYGLLLVFTIGSVRVLLRGWFLVSKNSDSKPVLIYGAGEAGLQLQSALRLAGNYRVVAHIDDDSSLWRTILGECSVYGPSKMSKKNTKENMLPANFTIDHPSTT